MASEVPPHFVGPTECNVRIVLFVQRSPRQAAVREFVESLERTMNVVKCEELSLGERCG